MYTTRQAEIIKLVRTGLTNGGIGTLLKVSEKTVKGHLWAIYKKSKVHSRHELVFKLYNEDMANLRQSLLESEAELMKYRTRIYGK